MPKTVPEPAENYKILREETLKMAWRKKGVAATPKNPRIWGLLMEVGLPSLFPALSRRV